MSNETPAETYDASSIQVLEGLEAVRKRPSMYIGSTDYKGLHHLVYEVVDNSIDEALAGYCNNIEVSINENGSVTVTDDGRGIPVEMHEKYKRPALEIVMTMLHAGGKFDNRTYKVSGGLHGVGVSVVNALSRYLDVEVSRNGKVFFQRYERGKPAEEVKVIGESVHTGTKTTFMPDNAIFETLEFQYDILANRLRELAYLNKGIKITLTDKKANRNELFHYEGGIIQFIEYLNEDKNVLHPKPIYFEREKDTTKIEIAMQYNDGYSEVVLAFANNINTHEGTHLSGFRSALTRSVNDYAKKNNLVKGEMVLSGEDIREGLTAIISKAH
jgi:DNA gyrase subunit B